MSRLHVIAGACVVLVWVLFVRPPLYSPNAVTIPEGVSIRDAGVLLKEGGAIVSAQAFSFFSELFGGARYGTYLFDHPASVIEVAWMVSRGGNAPTVRVTIPEGASVREARAILEQALLGFDSERFASLAEPHEGYLFPETYFFAPGVSPVTIVESMRATFDDMTKDLAPSRDVIIMASLLEKEARQYETRQVIAGILWKRLDAGMPLQVDAVFGYILGTGTINPTFEQLKIDSPYNTYTNKGLPPGPIGNPGLNAIEAALNPTKTPYWYYLTGSDGLMHYAKTFEEHVANRKYLTK